MNQEAKDAWILQIHHQTNGLYDAAGLLMRVWGSEAEKYAETIRMQARKAEDLLKKLVSEKSCVGKGTTNGT